MSIADDLDAQAKQLEEQAAVLREAARRMRRTELTEVTHGVYSDDMPKATPKALNAIAKTKSDAPKLQKVLANGWSVRQLTEAINKEGVKITHAHLGRMLKDEAPMREDVKAAIHKVAKIRV